MRIFISGIGLVSPAGIGREHNWDEILSAGSYVDRIPECWHNYMDYHSGIWAPLPKINYKAHGFRASEIIQNDQSTLMAMLASREALEHAGIERLLTNKKKNQYTLQNIDSKRCSVIYGTGSGGSSSMLSNFSYHALSRSKKELQNLVGDNEQAQALLDTLLHPSSYNPFAVPMSMGNSIPAGIGIKYAIHGSVKPIVQACSSGTTAIGEALLKIRSGLADLVITGGSEYLTDDYGALYHGFDVARTLAKIPENGDISKANRPFDKNRSGFLMAQGGAATLVIENEEHLVKRGGTAIAEIVGYSETFDASSVMAPEKEGVQIERMIRDVLYDAKIHPEDIDYINAHGTGTLSNDEVESNVIERVFGNNTALNSTKSIIGHTIAASGAIEAAVCALSLRDQVLHPSANIDNPMSNLDFVREEPRQAKLHYTFTESFAFGGHNSGLVLKAV